MKRIIILITAALLFAACDGSVYYDHSQSVDEHGWLPEDKLTFDVDESSYLIHLDDVTGPGGTLDQVFPLELELDDVWDYVPQEW